MRSSPSTIKDLIHRRQVLALWSVFFTCAVALIATCVLIGWASGIDALKRPLSAQIAMNPVSAVCFLFLAAAMLMLRIREPDNNLSYRVGIYLSVLVIIISLLKIAGELFFPSLKIDRIFFPSDGKGGAHPGQKNGMAIDTAVAFTLSGILLLLSRTKKRLLPDLLAIAVFLFGFLSLLGYLFIVPEYYNLLKHLPMSLYSGICFVLIPVAYFLQLSDRGFGKEIFSQYSGGVAARVLLPGAIIIPTLLGWIYLHFHTSGLVSSALGMSLVISSIIVLFLIVVIRNVIVLNRKDYIESRSAEKFRGLLESSPDAVIIADESGIIQLTNRQTEILFGYSRAELLGKPIGMLVLPEKPGNHGGQTIGLFLADLIAAKKANSLELFGKKKTAANSLLR